MNDITLVCQESFQGIMTGIYDGWVFMNKGMEVHITVGTEYEPTFFSRFIPVNADEVKAEKVAKSIEKKICSEAYRMVFRSSLHYDKERGDAIFDFLKLGYASGAKVVKMLGRPQVMRVMELSRKVSNETHYFKEFLRFRQLKGNVLYGRIEPKCRVLPLLYYHFQSRFPEERWIIYDAKHREAAVHPAKGQTVMLQDIDVDELTKGQDAGREYEDLWKIFFDSISIESRRNSKLQQTNMPLWYRKNAVEFEQSSGRQKQ